MSHQLQLEHAAVSFESSIRHEPDRLYVLDSIRGVAALIVLIHHCLLTQPAFSNYFFSNWQIETGTATERLFFNTPLRLVWGGTEAVTLFYVLSGLVLALPWVEGRPPPYLAYAIRRVCRLYLPYSVAVAFAASLAIWLHPYANVAGLSDWINTMNWTKDVTPVVILDHVAMLGHKNMLNGVIHTLIWEMRISLIFPFLIAPIIRWRLRGVIVVTLMLLAVVFGLQFIYDGTVSPSGLMELRPGLSLLGHAIIEVQWTVYYCTLFVFGSCVALYIQQLRQCPPKFAGVLLAAGLLIFQGHWSRQHMTQEFMVAFGAILIIISALATGPIHQALAHPLLRWMGQNSFSLYLIHVPLLLASVILLHAYFSIAVILIFVVVASVAFSWIFNIVVVEPSARFGKVLAQKRLGFLEYRLLERQKHD